MRVVQVTAGYPPSTGGIETHVQKLSQGLVERGHDVIVLTADGEGDTRRSIRDGVQVIRHVGASPSNAFHFAPGILRTLRGIDADVVHAHNYHSLTTAFAATATAPFVVSPHYHGSSASPFRNQLLRLYRPLGTRVLMRADAVVAVSNWESDRLREEFGLSPRVIPNGIDVNRFQNAVPETYARPYMLCVGRLEEYKGVQQVIRSLTHLPEYDLRIAGTGPYEERLRELVAEEGLGERVEFLGYVSEERLPRLYAGASVYVTMSSFEAFGLTVGEALAAGVPCVVKRAGALVDWTDYDGCVAADGDLPEAVRQARDREPDPTQLTSWDEMTNSVVELYESLV